METRETPGAFAATSGMVVVSLKERVALPPYSPPSVFTTVP